MKKIYKAILLILLPFVVIIGGAIFHIPYSGTAGFFIIIFYIILGNLYGTDRFKDP